MTDLFCSNCGHGLAAQDRFCANCGAPVQQPRQPIYQQPVYQQPIYQQPIYQQPVYQQPVYQQPVYPSAAVKAKRHTGRTVLLVLLALIVSGVLLSAIFGQGASAEDVENRAHAVIENYDQKYLLQQLDTEQLENVCAIYESVMSFEDVCHLPNRLPYDETTQLMILFLSECPELLQVDPEGIVFCYELAGQQRTYEIEFTYAMTERRYQALREECESVLNDWKRQTRSMTDEEKERFVYDEIAASCVYRMDGAMTGNAYGALVDGYAKCDGISHAFQWAMQELGIPCICLEGDPPNGDIGHAWNVVQIGGRFLDVDLTASVPNPGEKRSVQYPAYNVSDTWIRSIYRLRDPFTALVDVPGTGSMEYSYHAQTGGLIHGDVSDAVRAMTETLRRMDPAGGAMTIQFISDRAYESFLDDGRGILYGLSSTFGGFSWDSVSLDAYRTVTIFVEFD